MALGGDHGGRGGERGQHQSNGARSHASGHHQHGGAEAGAGEETSRCFIPAMEAVTVSWPSRRSSWTASCLAWWARQFCRGAVLQWSCYAILEHGWWRTGQVRIWSHGGASSTLAAGQRYGYGVTVSPPVAPDVSKAADLLHQSFAATIGGGGAARNVPDNTWEQIVTLLQQSVGEESIHVQF